MFYGVLDATQDFLPVHTVSAPVPGIMVLINARGFLLRSELPPL